MAVAIDLVGMRFGRWKVLKKVSKPLKSGKGTTVYFKCRCGCGTVKLVSSVSLRMGQSRSCGCLKFADLANMKFGRLLVIKMIGKNKTHQALWECQCDCGNKTISTTADLKSGNKKSCGCLQKEHLSKAPERSKRTHEKSKTRIYRAWAGMKNRCSPSNKYTRKYYHDRGIKVCESWENSFEVFYKWSIQKGYQDNLSLDRINNNKGYYPRNCRWVDHQTQMNNTSRTLKILYEGKEYTIKELSEELSIPVSRLREQVKLGKYVRRK